MWYHDSMAKKKNYMVWMDMEMTGLNPEKDKIIEIATVITDSGLNVVAEGPHLVIHQPPSVLKSMDRWNRTQHKKSGLTEAVKVSKASVREAEKATLDFIKRYCVPQTALLCGNSIHHDRRFLIRYMPRIHRYLHYRMVDVSTLKDLIQRWYPSKNDLPKKGQSHRAVEDIRESIEELRFYREHFFKGTHEGS